jgi:hypothetical protein
MKIKKEEENLIITSTSLVMSDLNLSKVGNLNELETICKNVQELDLSKNDFKDWNQVTFLFIF